MALVPLASSASVVSVCSVSRLADRSAVVRVERAVGLQADPLMETSWQSWALVEPEKSRLLSAVLAPHCSGVGVAPQLSWATWFATASFHMASHWAAVRDAVMTLDGVRRPPDAVISWLTVTSVLAKPWILRRR